MFLLLIFLICYLIAAINPAILISKKVLGTDIRELGSGNAGTTNTYRVMGLPWAIVVFFLDLFKVFIAFVITILLAKIFKQDITFAKQIFTCSVVIGHCYPIYYGFKGGKGVATAIMAFLLIDPKLAGICITAGIFVLLTTGMVSAASLSGVILLSILTGFLAPQYFVATLFVTLLILFKHRKNVARILAGEENRVLWKNRNKKQ